MTRLTIDDSGTVRLIDDDGTVLDTVIIAEDGRSTHANNSETGYLRRFVTEWVADDPAPEYSDLDRMDIYVSVSVSDVADEGRARLLVMLVVMGLGVLTLAALLLLWLVFP